MQALTKPGPSMKPRVIAWLSVPAVVICVICLVSGPISAFAQRNFGDVTIETTDLGGGIYMMTGAGGNIGLSVGEDAVIMIDDQFAPLSDRIAAAIAEVTDRPVTYLFNTHFHGDHTGGNENFAQTGAKIIAQDNVRRRLEAKRPGDARGDQEGGHDGLPVITFSDELTMHLNGDTVQVIHIPHAHTDGDAVLWFSRANAIHMGDTLFSHRYPFIDRESGGHIDGLIAGYERILGVMDDKTKLIAGHGPVITRPDLQKSHAMLIEVRDRIKTQISAGKTLEEVLAAEPLADLDEEWAPEGSFIDGERLTRGVYLMLSGIPDASEQPAP